MNKRFCIMTWIYGRRYQGWIPLYVYSIKKNYPQYDILIFLDGSLSISIKHLLEEYNLYSSVEIIENFYKFEKFNRLSEIEKRCYRWLIYAPSIFDKYEYMYIGDVDIYIVRENVEMLDQHLLHINQNGGVYSNTVRLTYADYKVNKEAKKYHLLRLTGLHFVDVKKYFAKVGKNQKRIQKYLMGKRLPLIDKLFFMDDERCLWLLAWISGILYKTPSYEIDDGAFRPLHGLHFALGREKDAYETILNTNSLKWKEHLQYYEMFKQEFDEDEALRKLIEKSPYYIRHIVEESILLCEKIKHN